MPPKANDKGAMAVFTVGHQLGAVGEAFMCSAIDEAPGFINAETGEEMEDLLNKEETKKKILKGELKPLGIEHIYHLFPRDKK